MGTPDSLNPALTYSFPQNTPRQLSASQGLKPENCLTPNHSYDKKKNLFNMRLDLSIYTFALDTQEGPSSDLNE